jgi:protein adenylyltransferase
MNPIPFDNSYTRLPDAFYSRLGPTPVSSPGPIRVNYELAGELGIDPEWLASDEGVATIAGNHVPPGADPLAAVYAGHQFGNYNPQLGDGRALLLGEVLTSAGHRYDIQLKGSGPTPYSRGGDGRSPLGPVLREYIVSEAMHALGVPTTRALAAVTTGEQVVRDGILPGAVLARVASSHIRIGTFQYFSAKRDEESLRALVEYTLQRHYPQSTVTENPALALLEHVIAAQAELVSKWLLLGFIHGVMNTDNMLVCGETVDYGPCAFMDDFHPDKVFSSIDHGGRYAYRNQSGIAHWNLAAFAQALLPILHEEQEQAVEFAQGAVDKFPALYEQAHMRGLAAKLGVAELQQSDSPMIEGLFELMAGEKADFTLTFRRLYQLATDQEESTADIYELPDSMVPWLAGWRKRLASDPLTPQTRAQRMRVANPAFIPRNHLVEAAIRAGEDNNDFQAFHALTERMTRPFDYDPADAVYATPPEPEEEVRQTFCGT